jgi:hypothetical protein
MAKNSEGKFPKPIGAMWAHADASGFDLRIDYLPLNDAEIVVRVAGDKQAEAGRGFATRANSRAAPGRSGCCAAS